MSKRNSNSKQSAGVVVAMATVAVSDKKSITLPQSILDAAKARGVTDPVAVAKSYEALGGSMATMALQLDTPAFWALKKEHITATARCTREARTADRDERLAFEKSEALARAAALSGYSEMELTAIRNANIARQKMAAPALPKAPKADKGAAVAANKGAACTEDQAGAVLCEGEAIGQAFAASSTAGLSK